MITLCIIYLSFVSGVYSKEKNCASGYILMKSENICLSLTGGPTDLRHRESICANQNGGIPFVRRMSDALLKEVEDIVWSVCRPVSAPEVFAGMQKDGSYGSTKWIYKNGAGSVERDDYPYWTRKPRSDEDCGKMTSSKFQVEPNSCNENLLAMCEKKENPCFHYQMRYMEYYGRCLSVSNQKSGFSYVENFCLDGYVVPYKENEDQKPMAAAMNTISCGIYSGLHKKDGKWIYESGEEETERVPEDIAVVTDIGVYGLTMDNSVVMFTAVYEGQYHVICEYIGDDLIFQLMQRML